MSDKCFKEFLRALNLFLISAILVLSSATTTHARFLTPDTWDLILAGVDFNRYAYSGNDPVNRSDPNGHTWQGLDSLFATKSTRGVEKANERAQDLIKQERKGLANLERAYRENDLYRDDYYDFVRSEKLRSIGQYQSFLNGNYKDLRNQMLANETAGIAQGAGLAAGMRGAVTNGAQANLRDRAATKNEASTQNEVTAPYKRPFGTTAAQKKSVQGKPCVDCGNIGPVQIADHKTSLVKEYYTTGRIDAAKAKSLDAVQPHCSTCSAKQGNELMRYSIEQRRIRFGH